ncbi:amino acid ABC transporter permease [Rhodobacter sp. 24-YEA-8]|uniref:amino acid ABC transporter permease n=1 Tax=Rhodobacter sp. 24-YEA-8 TaxID=1884310 RepID=UPI000899C55C|nr:amino acid ABC transporter permease [Rhodobacter sp. 24-YEA-8]SED50831.1 amino acid ABC transporter membrane protein 2, PAAT family [Rhodobacter sp. 24-YEA-8]
MMTLTQFNYILTGAMWTVGLSLIAFIGGGLLGFIIALMRVSPNRWIRGATWVYIQLIQGTPLLILLFLSYFGMSLLGYRPSPFFAVALGFSIYASAFLGEIWRGAIESVNRSQWEASACLGFDRFQQLSRIIIPQAVRIATPPTVGFMVQVVKHTSLASIVGFVELTRAAQVINNAIFQPFMIYLLIAAIYFAICYPLSQLSKKLEGALNVSGR